MFHVFISYSFQIDLKDINYKKESGLIQWGMLYQRVWEMSRPAIKQVISIVNQGLILIGKIRLEQCDHRERWISRKKQFLTAMHDSSSARVKFIPHWLKSKPKLHYYG